MGPTMSEVWQEIEQRWRASGIASAGGASAEAIAEFEARFQVAMPSDVRGYFASLNGTGWEMDNDNYRFWSLDQVRPVQDELSVNHGVVYSDRLAYPDCFVFADYLISCHLYAVKLTADAKQSAPVYRVTASDTPGEQMASSFLEFMGRYATNPDSIL